MTYCRSTDSIQFQFELLIGTKMSTKEDLIIRQLIDKLLISNFDFQNGRKELRQQAKQQIRNAHNENRTNFNRRCKIYNSFTVRDIDAMTRTQGDLKLKPKYLGPPKIVKVKPNDTYGVMKTRDTEGPFKTTTCGKYLKPWPSETDEDTDKEACDVNVGRMDELWER